jgi:hypothetical protein
MFDLPLRSNKLNNTGQFPIILTMVIADQTFWYSSLEALIMQTFVMGFTYFTTQKHHNFTDKLKDMARNCIQRKTKTCDMGTLPWNDPSDEARPHSPKFTRMQSLIAFETLNWVMIMGSSPTRSLLGSKKTSTTMYLFLNPTMIVLYLPYNTPN